MSEQSQGPGWWLASDGKWYPPAPPPPGVVPPPPQPQRVALTIPVRAREEWIGLAGAVAMFVGSFMTWVSAGPFSVAGTEGDGWITVALAFGAGFLIWKAAYPGAITCALIAGAVVGWKILDISTAEESFFTISPGIGLFVVGAGAVAALVASAVMFAKRR